MPLSTWRQSARYPIAASTGPSIMLALKNAIDAENIINPTTSLWQVADYNPSSATGTLVIKPTSNAASGVGARRVMFFGGTTVGSAAAMGNQTGMISNGLACGVSPTANVDAPVTAYNAGAPFADWLPGGVVFHPSYMTPAFVNYFEMDQSIIVVLQTAAMSGLTDNINTAILGQLCVSIDGTTLYDCAMCSAGAWTDRPEGPVQNYPGNASHGPFPTHLTSMLNSSYSMSKVKDLQDGIISVCTGIQSSTDIVPAANLYTKGRIGRNNERYFFPVPMRGVIIAKTKYKMRQMAYGTTGTYGEVVSDVGGIKARMLGSRGSVEDQGIWLTNFQA